MCFENTWGSVCDEGWQDQDAEVVCRHQGYSSPFYGNNMTIHSNVLVYHVCFMFIHTVATASYGSEFGIPYGTPVVIENVTCTGNESTLLECPNAGYGNTDVYCHGVRGENGINHTAGVWCTERM